MLSQALLGRLESKRNLKYIDRIRSNRAVNTVRLGYKNHPVNAA